MNQEIKQLLKRAFINKDWFTSVLSLLILVVITKTPVSIDFTYVDKALFTMISAFFSIECFNRWGDSLK